MIRVLLFALAIILIGAGDATAQFSSIGGGGGGAVNYCVPTTCTGGQVITGCPGPGQAFTCGSAASSGVVSNSASANPVARYGGAGQTVTPSTIISDDGTNAYFSGPIDFKSFPAGTEIANEGVTGTTVNKIAKLTGAPSTAIITATTDVNGAAGVVVSGAGITSKALIAVTGQVNCIFDGATVANHYVTISSSTAGDCHDAGASPPAPPTQVLGQVIATGAGGSTAMLIAVASGSGAAAGSVTSVTVTPPATLMTGSGCTITSSGTCTLSMSSQSANLFLLSPNGSSGAPTWRIPAVADFPANVISYAKMQQVTGSRLLGNTSGSTTNVGEIPIAARLRFNLGALDVALASIDNTFLVAGAATANIGALGGDQSGNLPNPTNVKLNGVAYPATPAVHQFPVITSAAGGGTATYKTITNCPNTVGTGNHWNYDTSTDTQSCGTDNGVSLTTSPGLKISPTPYNIGAGTISPNWPINQTCQTANYTIAESDSATSICMNGTNLTLTVNSSASNYLPAGEAFTVANLASTNLTVSIGTGSSTFKNSPGTSTSFTIPGGQNAWAIIQSDGAGAPNNYWVFPSAAAGAGGSGSFVKISTQTASSSASLAWTGLGSTYTDYFLSCSGLIPATNATPLYMQSGTGAGPTYHTTAQYAWSQHFASTLNTTVVGQESTGDSGVILSPTGGVGSTPTTIGVSTRAIIHNLPSSTQVKLITFESSSLAADDANQESSVGSGYWFSDTTTFTALRVVFGTAGTVNISSGACTLWGLLP